VVLIADTTVKQSPRYGQYGRWRDDSLLECHVLVGAAIDQQPEDIRAKIAFPTLNPIGMSTWREQPWHPFMLEWEVEVLPL
jgi:hypothetical protein